MGGMSFIFMCTTHFGFSFIRLFRLDLMVVIKISLLGLLQVFGPSDAVDFVQKLLSVRVSLYFE